MTTQTDKILGQSKDTQTDNIIEKFDQSGTVKQFRDFAMQTQAVKIPNRGLLSAAPSLAMKTSFGQDGGLGQSQYLG